MIAQGECRPVSPIKNYRTQGPARIAVCVGYLKPGRNRSHFFLQITDSDRVECRIGLDHINFHSRESIRHPFSLAKTLLLFPDVYTDRDLVR